MHANFNQRELLLLLNSTNERAIKLIYIYNDMSQTTYRNPDGSIPTKETITALKDGYEEHLKLVAKLQTILKITK